MDNLSYFQMRAYLSTRENNGKVKLKISELENIWHCTLKNVKRKLKQFEEKGNIRYEPGRGRGNLSTIFFNNPFWDEFDEAIQKRLTEEQIDAVIKLLQLDIPETWLHHYSNQVQSLFGLKSNHRSKDVLRTIFTRKLTTLDPLFCSISRESYFIQQLGDTLVAYNEGKDCIEPHLAHAWKSMDKEKVWIFYLRKGVRFHHQKTLTSEDVKYTFERFQRLDSPYHWLVENIKQITCPNPTTVCFELKHPNPFFIRYVSAANLVILPSDIPFDEWNWIGTGPFKMKERTESKLVLEAFDDYFKERPLLDEVQFWRVSPGTVNGISYQVDRSKQLSLSKRKEFIEPGFHFLAFNFHQNNFVQDISFREAIYHILNIPKMWKDLKRNNLVEASSFVPERSRPLTKTCNFIPALLQNSSYKGEKIITYALNRPRALEEAKWFQKEAKKAGVNIAVKLFDMEEIYSPFLDHDADLLFLGEVATLDQHLSFLGAFYNKALIFRRFLSPDDLKKIDSMLEDFKKVKSREEREEIIFKIESYIKDKFLFIFMYHPLKTKFFDPMLKNIEADSFTHINLRKLWIKTEG